MDENEKKTSESWPSESMASIIIPNGLRKIYKTLRDPKEQDAVAGWIVRYLLTGEDREGYKVPEYLKILLKDEVLRIIKKQRANAANGRRGGSQTQANRKRAASEAASESEANEKRTASEREASEKRTSSKGKGKGKDIYPDPDSPLPKTAAGGSESGSDRGSKEPGQPERLAARWSELVTAGESMAELVAGVDEKELPELALWYCMEQDNEIARKVYRGTIRRAGAGAFRQELAEFVSECGAGEEPDCRGRAFMARVKRLQ